MKTWNVFSTFESVDETLWSDYSNYWLKTFTCLLHSFSERSEICRTKKIIVTFSAPQKAMSDKPNSNITKSRKKAYKNYCCDEQISMRNALIFIQAPSPYSLRKYEEPISLENFYEDILDLKRFSVSFYLSLWKTQRILIFLIYHRRKHINTWLSFLDTWLYLWAEFSNCPCCRWPWDWKRIASLAPCLLAGSPFGGVARSHARVARCCRSLVRSHAACFARHTWRAC